MSIALRDFSNVSFTPQEFIDGMDRLKPRLIFNSK